MGNNLRGISLLNNVHYFPYHVQLGSYASIDVGIARKLNHLFLERTVVYKLDGSVCAVHLIDYEGPFHTFAVELRDDICSGGGIRFWIRRAENDLLDLGVFRYYGTFPDQVKTTQTYNPWGGITKTDVFLYGSGSKGGLLVVEQKINNGDTENGDMQQKNPYKVTVAHYYTASSGNVFNQNKFDIGLSLILNIGVSNNKLDFTVEGPILHPSAALFYMFEQVFNTGIWKPTACSHCAALQRQSKSNDVSWQSESEDTDSSLPPPPRHLGPGQNAGTVIANHGVVRGNNNGNFNFKNLFLRGS